MNNEGKLTLSLLDQPQGKVKLKCGFDQPWKSVCVGGGGGGGGGAGGLGTKKKRLSTNIKRYGIYKLPKISIH